MKIVIRFACFQMIIISILMNICNAQTNFEAANKFKNQGIQLFNRGQYQLALQAMDNARRNNNQDPEIYYYLGRCYANIKPAKDNDAVSAFKFALFYKPHYPEASLHLGLVYKKLNNINESIKYLELAKNDSLFGSKANYNLGKIFVSKAINEKLKELSESYCYQAIKYFEQVKDKGPIGDSTNLMLGKIYLFEKVKELDIEEKNRKAIRYFKWINRWIQNDSINYFLGQCYRNLKNDSLTEKHFNDATKLTPSYWKAHFELAELYFKKAEYKNAISRYDSTLRYNHDEPRATFMKYQANNLMEKQTEKTNFDIAIQAGEEALKKEDWPRAFGLFEKALPNARTQQEIERVLDFRLQASQRLSKKRSSDLASAMFDSSNFYYNQNDFESAKIKLEIAYFNAPDNKEIKQRLNEVNGQVFYQKALEKKEQRKWDEAEKYFNIAYDYIQADSTTTKIKIVRLYNEAFKNKLDENFISAICSFDSILALDHSEELALYEKQKLQKEPFWYNPFLYIILFFFISMILGVRQHYRLEMLSHQINPYICGSPILSDAHFIGRQAELNRILSSIPNSNFLLLGERRIGKTSFLKKLYRDIKNSYQDNENFQLFPIFIDLQGIKEIDFFKHIFEKLIEELKIININFIIEEFNYNKKNNEYSAVKLIADIEKIFKKINSFQVDKENRLVFIIDEFDRINDFEEITHSRFRSIFMNDFLRIVAAAKELKTKEGGTSPLHNIVTRIQLNPLTDEEAKILIQKPIKKLYTITEKAITEIIDITNKEPYKLQVFCETVISVVLAKKIKKITENEVNEAKKMIPRELLQETN